MGPVEKTRWSGVASRARKLSGESRGREKEGEGFGRMGREMTAGRGDSSVTSAVEQGDRQVAQAGHDLRGVPGAQAGVILAEGDIADVVALVLDTPVGADKVEQSVGRGRRGGQAGDEGDDLSCGMLLGAHGARELPHLGQTGPAVAQIEGHLTRRAPRPALRAAHERRPRYAPRPGARWAGQRRGESAS